MSGEKEVRFRLPGQHSETASVLRRASCSRWRAREVQGVRAMVRWMHLAQGHPEAHAKSGAEMVLYSVNAVSGSTESWGEVTVRLPRRPRGQWRGVLIPISSWPRPAHLSARTSCTARLNGWLHKVDLPASPG